MTIWYGIKKLSMKIKDIFSSNDSKTKLGFLREV
jgi:hypothetical protein